MPYKIVRISNGAWLTNSNGDVMLNDEESNILWIPYNEIDFDERDNSPYIKDSKIPLSYKFIEENEDENILLDLVEEENVNITDENLEISQSDNDQHDHNYPYNDCDNNVNDNRSDKKTVWEYNNTLCLINAVEEKYEDMYHPKKKKNFWTEVTEILISQNIETDPQKCKKKWENLIRTYKTTKDRKRKTGTGPSRFIFFDRLDHLLGDKPNNCSPHSIDVSTLPVSDTINDATESNIDNEGSSSSNSNVNNNKRKRTKLNPSTEYIKLKQQYYSNKEKIYKKYVQESLYAKNKKNELLEKKLALEVRKVEALENLVKNNK